MKYTIIIILIVITSSYNLYAQEFKSEIYGGVIASQIDGDRYAGYNKAGLIIGGAVSKDFNKKWAWQMGLRYSQKGSKFSNNKSSKYYKAVLHYIDLPVTIRYYQNKKISYELGLSFNYLIKALEDKGGYGLEDAYPSFNSFELASVGGVYYHFTKKLSIGGHISYSILPIRPYSSGNEAFMDKGQYNNLFYFAMYYKLSSWR